VSGLRLLILLLVFDPLALVVLYPHIDPFSVGYLLIGNFLFVFQSFVYRHFSKSPEICKVFYGQHFDSLWDKVAPVFGVSEFAIFFDYGHRLGPFRLVRPPIQSLGLLILVAACLWLVWADRYFMQQFESHYHAGTLLTDGPFRYTHHPRYLGLALTRVSLVLIFGSALAVAFAIAWLWLIRRRIRLQIRRVLYCLSRSLSEVLSLIFAAETTVRDRGAACNQPDDRPPVSASKTARWLARKARQMPQQAGPKSPQCLGTTDLRPQPQAPPAGRSCGARHNSAVSAVCGRRATAGGRNRDHQTCERFRSAVRRPHVSFGQMS
jgi:hypothetical protein